MGLRTDCALWVLVLAASGCTFPGIELGGEDSNHGTAEAGAGNELGAGGASATSNATGGSAQAPDDATGGITDDPTDATGGITDDPTDATGGITDDPTDATGGITDDPTDATGGITDDPTDATGGTADDPTDATGGTADDPSDATGGTTDDPTDATGGTTEDPECVPRDVVLPERCGDDAECVVAHGSGWTCDTQNTVQDACGNEVAAPTCVDSGEPGPDECEPMTYYGPMPCSEDSDCVEIHGDGWVCDVTATVATDTCGNTTVWPMCVDSGEPGPDECEPMTYYGPMPCSEDSDCVEIHGDGWVCDVTATVATDTCGNTTVWPMCIDSGEPGPVECEPLDIYGPMPCSEDADCVEQSGEGWVCDLTATVAIDSCGNTTVWPTCIDSGEPDPTDPDPPLTWYGPEPCTDDAECVERNGEGWYCDAGSTGWPICLETPEQ